MGTEFSSSGLALDCPVGDNLCVRAVELLRGRGILGAGQGVVLHLHKQLPFGAGLGAGSANCAGVLVGCNDLFGLGLSVADLEGLAGELGSDTPFFVRGSAAVMRGRGELLEPLDAGQLGLGGRYLVLVKPPVGVSTAQAFSGVDFVGMSTDRSVLPSVAVQRPVEEWRWVLVNDFEPSVFAQLPQLSRIKESLYAIGAIYASMSGSGSTIYGIFDAPPGAAELHQAFTSDCLVRTIKL